MTSQKTTKSTTKPTTKSATNPVKDTATKTTDKKACHCNDNCVRHGDCGCENCNDNHNDDYDSYGRMLPISQRILGHILSVDDKGLEDIRSILENTSIELKMGHEYLEMLSKERVADPKDKVIDPFPIPDTKLIAIFKQMESDIQNAMTACEDAISDFIAIREHIEDMKKDGQVWKDIAEWYLGEDSDEEQDGEEDEDNDDNEEEWR